MPEHPPPPPGSINHPPMLDLTIDNITPNVERINSQSGDRRLTYLMSRLTSHLHDFARETRLSSEEWMAALDFLVGCGQISSDVRHEFILLSDVLGLSLLVDSINHPKPSRSTEGSVLGPFHTHDAPVLPNGSLMSHDPEGEPMLAVCRIVSTDGKPLPGAMVDIWETDSSGHYDVQHAGRQDPSERCILESDADGRFCFRGIKPVSYPIPNDGPVGKLLEKLKRHCWRPAHVHFMFQKDGYDNLITALYLRGDPFVESDAVFGVKASLVIDLEKITAEWLESEKKEGRTYEGVKEGEWLLKRDFVLVTEEETKALRNKNAKEAMEVMGLKVRLEDGLPVPEIDASDLD
ncbi:putative dioxygenase [Zalerion maritima]|uniref:Dioxygenase n=1 Tax=Zalerion maritima TaxID=339359 RepID=A0AAD5WVQ0_9PEZI|nr:putative dioxygenase [Zalerion maritima]